MDEYRRGYGHRRGRSGAVLLTPRSPENQSADALLARLAVLFSSGHRRAVGVFGEGYEARLPILTGPVPEGGVPDGIR